ILQETNSGVIVNFDAEEKLKLEIVALYQKYKEDKLTVNFNNIEKYHRKELTKKLAFILKSLNS
ncbi:MAG: glycosyl transferase family 1, partial [Polaribacter sp.]